MADKTTTIPKGWIMTTLGEVAKVLSGSTPSTKEDAYWDGDIPWITPKDLSGYSSVYIQRGERNITNEGLKNSSAQILPRNTILFSSRAPIGYVAIAKNDVTTNQGFKNIICSEKESHFKFFYYWLKKNTGYIEGLSSGSTFSEASATVMKSLLVELPPISEQRAIATVLSSLDDKIELLREQNKTLEATAQAIFKEWFVNFNFPNEEGKPYKASVGKMIDSELGEIPEGWRVGKLGEVIELFDSKRVPLASDIRAKRKGQYPYYGATSIMDYIDDYLFDGTYLLLAEDGSVMDNNGRPMLQFVWGKFWVSNHAHVIQGKNGFSTEMLQVLLKNANVAGIVNGAVQLKINQANLLSFEILIPTKEIVRNFDSILQPIFQKIKNIISQIETLSQLRDTLLSKLMRGEVRVKGFKD